MKKTELTAFRTLIRIRVRRQDALERARIEAQQELTRLMTAADEAAEQSAAADAKVQEQNALIDGLMRSRTGFQINEYVAQQDYKAVLEEAVAGARDRHAQALSQVQQQEIALCAARAAAAANIRQREKLEDRVRSILAQLEARQMDDEDEEAEESVVTRKHLKGGIARADAASETHA